MQKKKLKNIIRSRHFSSCFFILTLLSTILFFVSTLLSIWQNNLQLKEQLEAKADAAYSNMENTFSVMKVGSVFIAKLASVNHILVSPDPTIDYFSRMISDISPYTQLYSFETICLYFDRSERVFDSSGGMYTYSDFYNPDFLQILSEMDTEEAWVVNIPYERYWQLARRNLLFTSPETEDFMIIGHQEDLTSSLDPNLSIQLSRALIDRDQTVARKIADSFFSRYLETANTQEARKLTTILLCEVYVALLDFGDDIPDTQLSPYLKKLENAADPSECSRIFFSCIQGLLNAKTKTSMEAHTYICQAISYIQQHYREELSVPQIADVVSLNPVYLSRLFKLDTGKTLSEYLNCYRTECSLALLTDTADTIQSISQKVGYSDVRSYIRFFKKYYDVTPSEYRRGAVGK